MDSPLARWNEAADARPQFDSGLLFTARNCAAGAVFAVALSAHVIAELQAGRFERIAHRHVNVLAVFAVDHNLGPGQHDVEPDRELGARLLFPMQRLDGHVAGPHALAVPLQLARLFTHQTLQRAGGGNAAQADVYGSAQDSPRLQPVMVQL